jgi:hypothetical protein
VIWIRPIRAGTRSDKADRPPRNQLRQPLHTQRRRVRHLVAATASTPAPEVAPAADSIAVVIHTGHMGNSL